MANFEDVAEMLESIGVVDVLLPFLLIFTLMFAILQKTKIMGVDKKNFNVIIALVISLTVIIPHITGSYPSNFDVVNIMNAMIPQIALIAVLIMMMLVLVGVFAPAFASWVAGVGAILVILLFLGTTNWLYGLDWLYDIFGADIVQIGVIILVFGVIIWFITSEKSTGGKVFDFVKDVLNK